MTPVRLPVNQEQAQGIHAESVSDPLDTAQGQVPLTPLQITHVRAVYPDELGEGLL